jgi:hypothetical protein
VFILFLIKPPTATGQSHSLAKFACPDIPARVNKFAEAQALLPVGELGAAPGKEPPSVLAACLGPRFAYTAGRQFAARVDGRRRLGLWGRLISSGRRFTVAAEFINLGSGMCEDLHWAAFLNEL